MDAYLAALMQLVKNPTKAQTMIFVAVVVGGLVRLMRTKKMNEWIAMIPDDRVKGLPKWAPKYLALALGFTIMMLNAKLNAGQSWGDAIISAVEAGLGAGGIAIGGHETLGKFIGALIYKPHGPITPPPPLVEPETPGGAKTATEEAKPDATDTEVPPVLQTNSGPKSGTLQFDPQTGTWTDPKKPGGAS